MSFCPSAPYSLRDYHAVVRAALGLSRRWLTEASSSSASAQNLTGRANATQFEKEFVKATLFSKSARATLWPHISYLTRNMRLPFVRFEDPEEGNEGSEAAARAWTDLFVVADDPGTGEILIPANIKYTRGGSADNICGWAALAHLLFSENHPKTQKAILKKIEDGSVDYDLVRDYFIWSFQHGDGQRLFSQVKVLSLLTVPPRLFRYNPKQAFPVQLNAMAVPPEPLSRLGPPISGSRSGSAIGPRARKMMFLTWLLDKEIERSQIHLERTSNARAAL